SLASKSAAITARASPQDRNAAPASASCANRSTKNRRAPRPGGNAAASRNAVNDIPPWQWGLDGPAGRRAARSAKGTIACIRPIARSADKDFSLLGPGTAYAYASKRNINPYAALARSTTAMTSGFSSHTRPSGRGGRRRTGLVAAGNAGANAGFFALRTRYSSRMDRNF